MIDWEYESRLIERISARKLIADRLTSRQRRVLCRHYRYGETQAEVAAHEGISACRVRQIVGQSVKRLQDGAARPPERITPGSEPQGFDKAAFLRHMRDVIRRREEEARLAAEYRELAARHAAEVADKEVYARELFVLESLLEREEKSAQPPPKPKPPEFIPPWLPWQPPLQIPPALQTWNKVEPWFDPARTPTPDDVHEIALYALHYLTAVLRPVRDGLLWLGSQQIAIVCDRNADAIAGALMQFSRGLPPEGVVMSTETDLMPAGVVGAEAASRFLAVRVLAGADGRQVEIGLTWDLMP